VLPVLLAASLVGCGSVETKETKPDPVVSQQPLDSPPAEEGTAPPIGKPRAKVAPSSMDKRSDSLLHDNPPH
jgi:hypothetical protein